MLAGS